MNRFFLGLMLAASFTAVGAQSFTFFNPPRYITHVTRLNGPFRTILIFNNNANSQKHVWVRAYNEQGEELASAIKVSLMGGQVEELEIEDALDPDTSHLLISGSRRILVSVRYHHATMGNTMRPHLHESNVAVKRYHVYAGTPAVGDYWQGAAIVNLVPNIPGEAPPGIITPPTVIIEMKTLEGEVVSEHRFPLDNSAKALKVFNALFPRFGDLPEGKFYFEIRSTVPLGVTALMGNIKTNDIASAQPAVPLSAEEVVPRDLNRIEHTEYELLSASLDADVLSVRASFDPSCFTNLVLFWSGTFMESNPPQTNIRLGLEGQSLFCLATELIQDFEYDLGGITRDYLGADGMSEPIIVHLLDENGVQFKTFLLNGEGDFEE